MPRLSATNLPSEQRGTLLELVTAASQGTGRG